MGQRPSAGLEGMVHRAEGRIGRLCVSGRYHRLPKRLEDDYIVRKTVLGTGCNGSVHMAESVHSCGKVAVKCLKLHGLSSQNRTLLESEAEIFLSMDHPHVARLVDVYESEGRLDLVMECLTGGELLKRVMEKQRFMEREAADAVWQMLLAVNYIHSHGVVHRDIKLENFLFDQEESDHLKLIDFGFSKIWTPSCKMALSCGTLPYVAPEVLAQSYTSQCDMWSLGVTAFVILFGYMPFAGSEGVQVKAIKSGKYTVKHVIWDRVSRPAKDFVKQLLVVDPEKRPTANEALEHPWIVKRGEIQREHSHMDKDIVDALVNFSQVSAFRRSAMLMMAWSLTNEEMAKVRQAFIELDVEKTGTITAGEFKRIIEDEYHITDDVAMQAFQALDANHDEEIHYSEFLAAMVSSRISMHDELLQATFRRFDAHGSGLISAADLREVLGDGFDGGDAEALVEAMDTSHDGKISYEEFIAYLKSDDADSKHQGVATKIIDRQLLKKQESYSHAFGMSVRKLVRRTTGLLQDVEEQLEHRRCRCSVRCTVL